MDGMDTSGRSSLRRAWASLPTMILLQMPTTHPSLNIDSSFYTAQHDIPRRTMVNASSAGKNIWVAASDGDIDRVRVSRAAFH
jgi:hypothetical protein